jgi:type IV secretion system protein VirB5
MNRSRLLPRITAVAVTAALTLVGVTPAQATMPVIDVAALAQLIQTILYWENQLQGMKDHLNQMRQTTSALTGGRGMQALLPLAPQARNYLPSNWTDVSSLTSGNPNGYGALTALVTARLQGVSVLPQATLAALTPDQRKLLTDGRNSAAVLQALSQTAYASTSARFQQLQSLIQAIGTATDEKAIADLQGRIQAEQAMLANDEAKLTSLYQAAQADRWSQEQRMREMSIAQLGSPQTLRRVVY